MTRAFLNFRQGDIVLVANNDEPQRKIIIISHDCDIASAKEAQLEVIDIIEIPTDSYDKNLENSKNVRSLHLRDVEGNCYSLNANNRRSLEKSVFIGTEAVVGLDKKTKDVLQIWLAARYFRHSFPDALDREVAGVIKTLAKNIKDKEDAIIGIFVRYEEINCTPNAEVYEFWVKIVYDPEKSDAG